MSTDSTTTHFDVWVNVNDSVVNGVTTKHSLTPQRIRNALATGLRANDPSLPTFTVDVITVGVEPVTGDEATTAEQLQLAMRRIDLLTGDLELIGNALKDEAVRRDWCAEYEAFVESVNQRTKTWDLPSRQRDYRVEHVYEVRIIGTVSAISDEDADNAAGVQYGQIRESYHFLLPTDQKLLPDRGQLHDVTWHHEHSNVTPEED